jgi:Ricin-type beta-trefoil lectin domain/Protein of unknown function (DUF3011)
MPRLGSFLHFLMTASLFLAASSPAQGQMQLQGRGQYGGLIRNVNSQKCVDVANGSRSPRANVQQFECNGGANQRWEFVSVGNGQYAIRSQNSGMVLDVADQSRARGANVQQYPWNGGANQRWRSQGPNNNFVLINVNSGKCLDVTGGDQRNGANIIQWDCNGGLNQRWYAGYSMGGRPGGPGPGYPPPGMGPGTSITCSSNNGKRAYCNADTRGNVQMVRQISGSPCIQGTTWGYDRQGIWVDKGCRAEFVITGRR